MKALILIACAVFGALTTFNKETGKPGNPDTAYVIGGLVGGALGGVILGAIVNGLLFGFNSGVLSDKPPPAQAPGCARCGMPTASADAPCPRCGYVPPKPPV